MLEVENTPSENSDEKEREREDLRGDSKDVSLSSIIYFNTESNLESNTKKENCLSKTQKK